MRFLTRGWRSLSSHEARERHPVLDVVDPTTDYELVPGERANKHVIAYPGDVDVRLEVFYKNFSGNKGPRQLAGGSGPVISLLVRGFEVMRFDCLGETGHYHIVFVRPEAGMENRLWFHEKSVREQVKRAIFEIQTNIDYYLRRNPKRQVREIRLDPEKLEVVCRRAQDTALSLIDDV